MITLNNLSYTYPKGVSALRGITTRIGAGMHLLLGENGSGKTTLLHIIAGMRHAQPIDSCMVNDTPTALRLPTTLQSTFLMTDDMQFPFPTINAMVQNHAVFYPSFSPELLKENLRRFNMTGDEPIERFSLGNRKKAQLAYVVALRPDILLFDEPLNSLDITSRNEFIKMLAETIGEEQTIIISSHTVLDFRNLIDGVIIISGGQLVLSMPLWQISDRLAFVKEPAPVADAIYMNQQFGSFNAIIANDGSLQTDVDLILFYSALQSNARHNILSHLTQQSQS